LKASSCVNAGEKVLDSIAKPAIAIRGSIFSTFLDVHDATSIIRQKTKME
jgi:hypothetical protein